MKIKLTVILIILCILLSINALFSLNSRCNEIFSKALRAQTTGKHKKAILYLERYRAMCGADPVYHYLMGESYFVLKSYYRAFKHYLAIPGRDPRFKYIRKKMAGLAKYFLTPEQIAELLYPITPAEIKPGDFNRKKRRR